MAFPPLDRRDALFSYLLSQVRASCDRSLCVREEDVGAHFFDDTIAFLYDALLDWMGPGRDPAYLDLYLLANARLPVTIGALVCPKFVENGEDEGWQGSDLDEEQRREVMDVDTKYAEPRDCHSVLGQIMIAKQRGFSGTMTAWSRPFWITMTPDSGYRYSIMGDSTPEMDFPPKPWLYFYKPGRWTDPSDRSYDPSGRRR